MTAILFRHICVIKFSSMLTHWGRVMHICVRRLTIIGSDKGLLSGWCQAIIRTNAGILLIRPLKNKFQWNLNHNSCIFIEENAFENVVWKMAAILSRPQCVEKPVSPFPCPQIFKVVFSLHVVPSGFVEGLNGIFWGEGQTINHVPGVK